MGAVFNPEDYRRAETFLEWCIFLHFPLSNTVIIGRPFPNHLTALSCFLLSSEYWKLHLAWHGHSRCMSDTHFHFYLLWHLMESLFLLTRKRSTEMLLTLYKRTGYQKEKFNLYFVGLQSRHPLYSASSAFSFRPSDPPGRHVVHHALTIGGLLGTGYLSVYS